MLTLDNDLKYILPNPLISIRKKNVKNETKKKNKQIITRNSTRDLSTGVREEIFKKDNKFRGKKERSRAHR